MYENLTKNTPEKPIEKVKKTEMSGDVAIPTLHSQIGRNCLKVQNITSILRNDLVKFQLELTCRFGGFEHSVQMFLKSEKAIEKVNFDQIFSQLVINSLIKRCLERGSDLLNRVKRGKWRWFIHSQEWVGGGTSTLKSGLPLITDHMKK